jgi:CubicO group peptidase (beta-lactamase class C family)
LSPCCFCNCSDEGKLDLNKPIAEYLPWIKINSKFQAITTHHILSHTGGLPGAPLLLDALLGELWTAWEPGKRFLYSNTGYNILGFLIEAIDKRPFAESMRARMLVPTRHDGQLADHYKRSAQVDGDRLRTALGRQAFSGQWTTARSAVARGRYRCGKCRFTPADMAKYMRMLLNRGALPKGRLLSEEGFALFTKPAIDSPYRGEPASYGYGIWVSDIGGHTRLRHTGGMVASARRSTSISPETSVRLRLSTQTCVAIDRCSNEVCDRALQCSSGRESASRSSAPPPLPTK